MPAQAHRRRYLYLEAHRPWEWPFGHLGKEYVGLVFGRWPLLAAFRDRTYYYDVGTFGICLGPWIEVGLFIDFRSVDEIMKDNVAAGLNDADPERADHFCKTCGLAKPVCEKLEPPCVPPLQSTAPDSAGASNE